MTYNEIISEVSSSVGLDKKIVNRIYKTYWKAIHDYITSLPLQEDLTDEEFLQLRPNINIPSIGKLYVSFDRYQKIREKRLKNK